MIIIEWKELLITAGLDEKEANIVCMLNHHDKLKMVLIDQLHL